MTHSQNLMTSVKCQNFLTFDVWCGFFNTLTDEQLHRHYDDIIQIPGVYEHFLEWDNSTQRQLISWTSSSCDDKDISLIVQLRIQLTELYPDICWSESGLSTVRNLASKLSFAFSKEHDALVTSLAKDARLGGKTNQEYAIVAEMSQIAAWLLSMMYGKERVGEVMQKFLCSNLEEYSISDLGAIIERWDEFYEYPIEWSVNTLDA